MVFGALAAVSQGFGPGMAAAAEISIKTENYLFAASEALEDGEPGLALSLLRRADQEDPEACIIQEYLCRCYSALEDLPRAILARDSFADCMEPADAPVLQELDSLLEQLNAQAAMAEPQPAESAPSEAPEPQAQASLPSQASTTQASGTYTTQGRVEQARRGHGGLVVMGAGGLVGIGFGVTSYVTYHQSRSMIEQGDKTSYENTLPLNHVSVILTGVGGGIAVTGLLVELLDSAASPHTIPPGGWPSPLPAFNVLPHGSGLDVTAGWSF